MNKAVINFLVLAFFFFLENDVPKMKPIFFFLRLSIILIKFYLLNSDNNVALVIFLEELICFKDQMGSLMSHEDKEKSFLNLASLSKCVYVVLRIFSRYRLH